MTNQTTPLCSWCGNEPATDEHHLLRRGSHPELISEARNIVKLGRRCHTRTEEDPAFYEALQEIFYYWKPNNLDLFLRAQASIEALEQGKEIEYLTPAMADHYLAQAGAYYGRVNDELKDLEKLWYLFCAERSKELVAQGERVTGTQLEREWFVTTNGQKMIDLKSKGKSLENLQSNLRRTLDRYRTESFLSR